MKVVGAMSLSSAREAAILFSECPAGIVLDSGSFQQWDYDDPKPGDWKDYYFFRTEDEYEPDRREWWEK